MMTSPLTRGALARLLFTGAMALACLFAVIGPTRAGERIPTTQGDASAILAAAERHLGQGNFTGMPGAWCGWFASAILRATGHRPLASGMATSALAAGPRVSEPRPGDLAVMPGHVTFFVKRDGRGGFIGLGGNQHHRVRYSRFALRSVIAFVRPT